MTDLRKAAEMALEAFDDLTFGRVSKFPDARKALRQALAQPEQKPVRWINFNAATGQESIDDYCDSELASIPLYTAPPKREWVGLTDEEVDECYYWKDRLWTTDELVRHVEAKLKEKNSCE